MEEQSFCNVMDQAYDLGNLSLFEVETVEEAPISPETSSSYDSTLAKNQNDQVALLKLHYPLQVKIAIKSRNIAMATQSW